MNELADDIFQLVDRTAQWKSNEITEIHQPIFVIKTSP